MAKAHKETWLDWEEDNGVFRSPVDLVQLFHSVPKQDQNRNHVRDSSGYAVPKDGAPVAMILVQTYFIRRYHENQKSRLAEVTAWADRVCAFYFGMTYADAVERLTADSELFADFRKEADEFLAAHRDRSHAWQVALIRDMRAWSTERAVSEAA